MSAETEARRKGLTHEDHIGDGVYVGWDGWHIILWTDKPEDPSTCHSLAMDPYVLSAFNRYTDRLKAALKQEEKEKTDNG